MRQYIVKPGMQYRWLEPTGPLKPSKTDGAMGTDLDLDHLGAAGWVFDGSQTKPNHFCGPNQNSWLVTWTRSSRYLQVWFSKLAWKWPPSSHKNGLQVHTQTHSITISECKSIFTPLCSPCVSRNTLNYPLGVNFWSFNIVHLEFISEFIQ
jgi:hypothetical protein